MKHILFSGNNAWGMWNFRSLLIKNLIESGYKCSISAPYDEIYFKKFHDIGCNTYSISLKAKGINPIEDLVLIHKYKTLLKNIKPDLSITYTIKPNIYASIAASCLNIKFLPITTGLGYTFLSNGVVSWISRLLYKLAFRKAQQVWFLNNDDVESFKSKNLVAPEKIFELSGEGVDVSRFVSQPLPDGPNIKFLLIGRMLRDKGIYEFVNAARYLKQKYHYVQCQLLGAIWKDNPSAITETEIEKWVEEGIVEYYNHCPDVRDYISKSTCIVLPSYREGVPCTLMEGAATSRPLVATNVAGCREVVIDGYNGYLCESHNWKDLADKMEKIILMSTSDRKKMGENGRKMMVEKFAIENIITQYKMTINNLLKS